MTAANGSPTGNVRFVDGTTLAQIVLYQATILFTASRNPSRIGGAVVFTAVIRSQSGVIPTGSITISEINIPPYGSAPLVNGTGVVTYSSLPVGSHVVTATYGGDSVHTGATSRTIDQIVNPAP